MEIRLRKALHRIFAILLATPLSTFAQPVHMPVGIAGIVLDEPVESLPRSLGLKCTISVMAIDAPSSKDPVVRSLQGDLQRLKARGNYSCYSERKSTIGRLSTQSVGVTTDHGRITGIYLSFMPEDEAGSYNSGARRYVTDLTEKRYGPSVASSRRRGWERWSPLIYEQRWKLPSAEIELVDDSRSLLQMKFHSRTRFPPNDAIRAAIAGIEKKIAARESKLNEKKAKEATLAERDLFPSRQ